MFTFKGTFSCDHYDDNCKRDCNNNDFRVRNTDACFAFAVDFDS